MHDFDPIGLTASPSEDHRAICRTIQFKYVALSSEDSPEFWPISSTSAKLHRNFIGASQHLGGDRLSYGHRSTSEKEAGDEEPTLRRSLARSCPVAVASGQTRTVPGTRSARMDATDRNCPVNPVCRPFCLFLHGDT